MYCSCATTNKIQIICSGLNFDLDACVYVWCVMCDVCMMRMSVSGYDDFCKGGCGLCDHRNIHSVWGRLLSWNHQIQRYVVVWKWWNCLDTRVRTQTEAAETHRVIVCISGWEDWGRESCSSLNTEKEEFWNKRKFQVYIWQCFKKCEGEKNRMQEERKMSNPICENNDTIWLWRIGKLPPLRIPNKKMADGKKWNRKFCEPPLLTTDKGSGA